MVDEALPNEVDASTLELTSLIRMTKRSNNNHHTNQVLGENSNAITSGNSMSINGNVLNTTTTTSSSPSSFLLMKRSMSLMSTTCQSTPTGTPHGSPWIRKPLSVVHYQEQHQIQHETSFQNSNRQSNQTNTLRRHLSVWDLIGIGVGGTVGSGIFVLTGQIASQYSGPGTFISMMIAGIAASCSGVCYAELSGRIPASGSTYVYAYVCWGEVAAVVAASCLTLEYVVAGAAVARTWGDKVIEWMASIQSQQLQYNNNNMTESLMLGNDNDASTASSWLLPFNGVVNIPAFVVSATSTLLLLCGVSESKAVMNIITIIKMLLVAIMIIGGFYFYNSSNMPPNVSIAPYGIAGILRGSTTSFFGFLGYDEVCCIAGEAKHPARDMPRAVLGTLSIVTICYVLASIALTGMIPYYDISTTSGFPAAFASKNVYWLSNLTAFGEVSTLPVVVVISLLAQPRLFYSMAQDGLLPSIFGTVNPKTGNLVAGTIISGIGMTLIATFVPFTYLDDLISAGILVAFTLTNSCLVLLRCKRKKKYSLVKPQLSTKNEQGNDNDDSSTWFLEFLLILYNTLCFITAICWTHEILPVKEKIDMAGEVSPEHMKSPFQICISMILTLFTICCLCYIMYTCPTTPYFGGSILAEGETDRHIPSQPVGEEENVDDDNKHVDGNIERVPEKDYFVTPAVPLLPCLGMAVNWYLIAQLEITGILLLCLYILLSILLYGFACAPYSVGHLRNWTSHNSTNVHKNPGDYDTLHAVDHDDTAGIYDDDDNDHGFEDYRHLSHQTNHLQPKRKSF